MPGGRLIKIYLSMLILLLSVLGVYMGVLTIFQYEKKVDAHLKTGNLSFSLICDEIVRKNTGNNTIISQTNEQIDFTKLNSLYLNNLLPGEMIIAHFTITNTGSTPFEAEIIAENIYALDWVNDCFEFSFMENEKIEEDLKIHCINPNESQTFSIIVLMKEETGNELQNQEIEVKIQVQAVQLV